MRTVASVLLIALVGFTMIQGCVDRIPLKDIPVTEDVSFETHIAPITRSVCILCHSQGSKDFTQYRNAYVMRQTIYRRVVVERTMPVGAYLSDQDRALFRDWVNQGGKK